MSGEDITGLRVGVLPCADLIGELFACEQDCDENKHTSTHNSAKWIPQSILLTLSDDSALQLFLIMYNVMYCVLKYLHTFVLWQGVQF